MLNDDPWWLHSDGNFGLVCRRQAHGPDIGDALVACVNEQGS